MRQKNSNNSPEIMRLTGLYIVLGVIAMLYIILACYLGVFLNFDFSQTDADYYWQDALNWRTPYNPYHVPGYSLLIALFHGLTPLSPLVLMMALNAGALLASMALVYNMVLYRGQTNRAALAAAALFALWPFVGLVYCVDPIADVPVMLFFLAGIFCRQRGRYVQAAVWWGIALIFHKAIWPMVGLTFLVGIIRPSSGISMRKSLLSMPIMLAPLACLWVAGSFFYQSPAWIIKADLGLEIASHSNLPVLDGIIGTLMQGGLRGMLKGGVIIAIAIAAIHVLYTAYRLKPRDLPAITGICLSILLLMLILNQHEVWASVRFSRLLVLPVFWTWHYPVFLRIPNSFRNIITALIMATLILSQFVYGWYTARVHYPKFDPAVKVRLEHQKRPYRKLQ